jgi:hypothetical protein
VHVHDWTFDAWLHAGLLLKISVSRNACFIERIFLNYWRSIGSPCLLSASEFSLARFFVYSPVLGRVCMCACIIMQIVFGKFVEFSVRMRSIKFHLMYLFGFSFVFPMNWWSQRTFRNT